MCDAWARPAECRTRSGGGMWLCPLIHRGGKSCPTVTHAQPTWVWPRGEVRQNPCQHVLLAGWIVAHKNEDMGKMCTMDLPCHHVRIGDGTHSMHLYPSSPLSGKPLRCSQAHGSNVSHRVLMLYTVADTRAM
jgi:hypothetical protein